jgi:hypothetical protein
VHSLGTLLRRPCPSPHPLGFEYIPWASCLYLLSYRSTTEVGHNNRSVLIARPSLGMGAQGLAHRREPPAMKHLGVLTGHFSPSVAVLDSAFLEPKTASRSRPLEADTTLLQ